MSNTGRNKKLASFNCDEELWSGFMQRCQEQGTTATATLTQFIELYLDGKLDNLDSYEIRIYNPPLFRGDRRPPMIVGQRRNFRFHLRQDTAA